MLILFLTIHMYYVAANGMYCGHFQKYLSMCQISVCYIFYEMPISHVTNPYNITRILEMSDGY